MSAEQLSLFIKNIEIDARYLFEQIGSLEQADLRNPNRHPDSEEVTELRMLLSDSRREREHNRIDGYLTERLRDDPELRECTEKLLANRGLVSKVSGYVDGLKEKTDEKGEAINAAG